MIIVSDPNQKQFGGREMGNTGFTMVGTPNKSSNPNDPIYLDYWEYSLKYIIINLLIFVMFTFCLALSVEYMIRKSIKQRKAFFPLC